MNDAFKGHFTDFPIKLLLFKPGAKEKEALAGWTASWMTDSIVLLAVRSEVTRRQAGK